MTINLSVLENELSLNDYVVVPATGSVGSLKLKFNFSQDDTAWENLPTKQAFFQYVNSPWYYANIDANGEVIVPRQVIAKPAFKIMLRGYDSNGVIVQTNVVEIPCEYSPQIMNSELIPVGTVSNNDGTLVVTQSSDVAYVNMNSAYKEAVDKVINDEFLRNDGGTATGAYNFTYTNDVITIDDKVISKSVANANVYSSLNHEGVKVSDGTTITTYANGSIVNGNATLSLPNTTGTLALTSDVATSLATAKDYADTQSASALSSAKTYADGQATSALDNANAFTTAEVNKIKNGTYVADKANRDGSGNTITRKYFADIDKTYNSNTGVLTLKLYSADNTMVKELEIDLPTESIIQSFTYDSTTKEIVMTDMAGNEHRIPVGDLVDTYTFTDGDTIQFTVSNNTVTCEVKNNSIDVTKLNEALRTLLGSFATDTDLEQGLSTKQSLYSDDSTQWDTEPTENSTKPVTSGGIYTTIEDAKTAVKEAVADIDVEDSNKKYITHLESREDGLYLVGEEI